MVGLRSVLVPHARVESTSSHTSKGVRIVKR